MIENRSCLHDYAKVLNGKTPSKSEQRDNGHPILKIKDVNENGEFIGQFDSFVEIDFANRFNDKIIQQGDILILNAAHSSKIVGTKIYRAEKKVIGSIATGEWTIVRPKKEIFNSNYAYFWLTYGKTRHEIKKKVKGIHLYPKDVGKIGIVAPNLSEQKRIADILDKADAIRRKRQEAIKLSEDFLRSVFLDMFGDPVTNPKGWEVIRMEDACDEIYRYPTFYGFKYVKIGVPIVRIGNILFDGFLSDDLTEYVFVNPDISNNYPRTILELNDILMAVRGDGSTGKRIGIVNTPNLVGANISPNLLRFKTNYKIMNPLYLFYFMNSDRGQKIIEKQINRTAKKTITSSNIKEIKIPKPDISFQNKFEKIVNISNKISDKKLLINYDNLFNSLIQKAFRGEL